MSNIKNIIDKITSDYEVIKENLRKELENKKIEIKNSFDKKLEVEKKLLEEKYSKILEIEKKRISTEEFIKFNKITESKKQDVLQNIFNKAKQNILNISKTEYKNFIKNLIIKNIFLNKKNEILFDETNKLNNEEKQNLINEILNENKDLKNKTEIIIAKDKDLKISFGIIIFSGKQSKDLSLDSILNMFKTDLEIEISKILFRQD